MLIKTYRSWKAQKELDKALLTLWQSYSVAAEARMRAFEEIIYARRNAGCSFRALSRKPEGMQELYSLYAHKQFMAYLVENVRQKQRALRRVKGKHDPREWGYGETFESSSAAILNQQLFDHFLDEYEPKLSALEHEWHPEDRFNFDG
jgi:hypothetical protein